MSRHATARLSNPQWETFAQERARGATLGDSYVAAGFKRSNQHSSRLASRPEVAARIAYLKRETTTATAKAIAAMDTGPSLAELGINAATIAWWYRCIYEDARQRVKLKSISQAERSKALQSAITALERLQILINIEARMAVNGSAVVPQDRIDISILGPSLENIIRSAKAKTTPAG